MIHRLLVLAVLAPLAIAPAVANDRPLTDDERAKLAAAVKAEGCEGGKFEFDDGAFEVDDARCSDGRTYDLDFDVQFRLIGKDLED